MELIAIIEKKLDTDKTRRFWAISKSIVADCTRHLTQITAQMPNYDIHDESHSQKVLSNIEQFLGENAERLSLYELMLIYLSCYLHDSAMALPSWEYNMLRAVEGCEECHDTSVPFAIRNDFHAPQGLSQLKSYIDQNKAIIYQSYEQVSGFVFTPSNEEQLQLDIAQRARAYEAFRNGFADKLSEKKADEREYLTLSELIRSEFIRKTHHTRAADYISNLRRKLSNEIGDSSAVKVLEDLSNVCKAHCESTEFVQKLDQASTVDGIGTANLRFVAIMLRLGDATHFSSDRAPVSLFSEKGITNSVSITHWKAKFADTNYRITRSRDGKKTIYFSAFCAEPSVYYFLHDYIDWIDAELGFYFSFLHDLEFFKQDTTAYDLQLNNKVDRTGIVADKEKFVPDNEAKFSMDQSKILSLLMGTQLYKDKFLCLRELYQNSLDACKCMKAQDESLGVKTQYRITFGLEADNRGRKYIYCLDNGTGMTKEIVKNYFLRIGNSYYKSQEFVGKNVSWTEKVNPTSQFGIGVLSCFMIGDSLEVTTKYYEGQTNAFSFCMEGKNEHFYYIPVNPLDEERIGSHGTLIKMFLSGDAQDITNELPDEAAFLIYADESHIERELTYLKEASTTLRNSLFYKVNKQIGILHPSVDVYVHIGERDIPLIQRNQIFDYKKLGVDEKHLEDLWRTYHFWRSAKNPYEEVLTYHDYIHNIPIHISENGVELDTFVTLPRKGIPVRTKHLFSFEDYIWRDSNLQVLVDGIVVSDRNSQSDYFNVFGYNLVQSGNIIINFTGTLRPILAIDRNSVVEYPDEILPVLKVLRAELVKEVVRSLLSHLREEQFESDSDDISFVLNSLLSEYQDYSTEILKRISDTEYGKTTFQEISKLNPDEPISIGDVITREALHLKDVDFKSLGTTANELLAGKMATASQVVLHDKDVTIHSTGFQAPISVFGVNYHHHLCYAIKADIWDGFYERYDIVTNIWPIVPERLFNKINTEFGKDCLYDESRIKALSVTGNGLNGMSKLEAALINPKFGISTCSESPFENAKSHIGRCESIQNNYWLFEINQHGKLKRLESKDYALFAYISPEKLSEEDEHRLQDYNGRDDTYVTGVKEGWSILFLGHDQTYYILPGIREKNDLIELIPPSIKERKDSIKYYNLDDTPLFG